VKTAFLFLSLPIAAALSLAPQNQQNPQDPQDAPATAAQPAEHVAVITLSEMQYIDLQGKTTVVPARNVAEIRVFDDEQRQIRLELTYDNGDYSLIDAQAIHILRNGPSAREVRLVRSPQSRMRFPKLL
jgi:hypothetical protein